MGKVNVTPASEAIQRHIESVKTNLKRKIDTELEAIDIASIRPMREIEYTKEKGKAVAVKESTRFDGLRNAAADLRNQRRQINKIDNLEDLEAFEIIWPNWR